MAANSWPSDSAQRRRKLAPFGSFVHLLHRPMSRAALKRTVCGSRCTNGCSAIAKFVCLLVRHPTLRYSFSDFFFCLRSAASASSVQAPACSSRMRRSSSVPVAARRRHSSASLL